jgi:hypothetical protein
MSNPFTPANPVRLSWDAGGVTYVLPFDACVLETHTGSASITSHPVEGGSVTDHITVDPDRLTLSGVYSNTPISKLSDMFGIRSPMQIGTSTVVGANPLQPRRAETLYEELDKLRTGRILVDVFTNVREYTDMAIASMTVPRDAARGGGVFVDVELVKVNLATLQTVALPSNLSTTNGGKKPTKPGNASETSAAEGLESAWAGLTGSQR